MLERDARFAADAPSISAADVMDKLDALTAAVSQIQTTLAGLHAHAPISRGLGTGTGWNPVDPGSGTHEPVDENQNFWDEASESDRRSGSDEEGTPGARCDNIWRSTLLETPTAQAQTCDKDLTIPVESRMAEPENKGGSLPSRGVRGSILGCLSRKASTNPKEKPPCVRVRHCSALELVSGRLGRPSTAPQKKLSLLQHAIMEHREMDGDATERT
jgi:hypothetical protein